MSSSINFPKDFRIAENGYLEDSIQYKYYHENPSQDLFKYSEEDFYPRFSVIIGKDPRVQSNGVNTYELYDFNTEQTYGDITIEQINEIINQAIKN